MQGLIRRLTRYMSADLAAKYEREFTRVYLDKDRPVIITLDDIKTELPYEHNTHVFRTSKHIGQRKLFNNELKFIVDHVPTNGGLNSGRQRVYVVYAGAAPGNPTGFLTDLLNDDPTTNVEIVFVLIDPNKFDIIGKKPIYLQKKGGPEITLDRARELLTTITTGTERIYIINDLFTMNIANAIAEIMPGCYFISDIRTNVSDGEAAPDSIDILWNLSQQYNWMSAMEPAMSMLKFRHPFYTEDPAIFDEKCVKSPYKEDFEISKDLGIDFVANFKLRKLIYWGGTVDIQPFPGPSSTETRLITDAKSIVDFGTPESYENKLYYYNIIERCYGRHVNPNADRTLGFDLCNDCALENHIWTKYAEKYPSNAKKFGGVKSLVKKLSEFTYRPLTVDNHGMFFEPYPMYDFLQILDDHNNNPGVRHLMKRQTRKERSHAYAPNPRNIKQ